MEEVLCRNLFRFPQANRSQNEWATLTRIGKQLPPLGHFWRATIARKLFFHFFSKSLGYFDVIKNIDYLDPHLSFINMNLVLGAVKIQN